MAITRPTAEQAIRESRPLHGFMENRGHGYVTVARLREWLRAFDDDAVVVVPAGVGYEEPRMRLGTARPVLVPQRYFSDPAGDTVIVLAGANSDA